MGGLVPLVLPGLDPAVVADLVATVTGPSFGAGRAGVRGVPSFDLTDPGHDPQRYWRGPSWLNMTWLVARGLARHGYDDLAGALDDDVVALVAGAGLHEYFHPLAGTGHGTDRFSWSAALLIDVLAHSQRWRSSGIGLKPATAPITVMAGGRMPSAWLRAAMSASVACTLNWLGRPALATVIAGVCGSSPSWISFAVILAKVATPIMITSVVLARGQRGPVQGAAGIVGRDMTRDHGEPLGQIAVGERDAGQRRGGDRRGDSGEDGDRDTGLGTGLPLLTAAAEDEAVAALEPDDRPSGPGVLDQQRVDRLLRGGGAAGDLADVDDQRARTAPGRGRRAGPAGRR